MEPIKIHVTDISKFRRCRRQWDLSVNQCLVKKSYDSGPFWFGTGLHKVLAHFYKNGGIESNLTIRDLKQVWYDYVEEFFVPQNDSAREVREKDNALAESMIENYFSFACANDSDWEILEVEKEYTYPIPRFGGNILLTGTFDLVVQNKINDSVYVVDHKTFANLADPENLEFDYQMTAYWWLAKMNGLNIRACVYNQLRKRIPAEPEPLKSGALSVKKDIDTTYDIFLKAINNYGLDEADYEDILEKLKSNRFNHREKIIRTARNIRNFESMLYHEVADIVACLSDNELKYPNYVSGTNSTVDCVRGCSYKSLCKCMNDGGDTDLLREMEYYVGEGR